MKLPSLFSLDADMLSGTRTAVPRTHTPSLDDGLSVARRRLILSVFAAVTLETTMPGSAFAAGTAGTTDALAPAIAGSTPATAPGKRGGTLTLLAQPEPPTLINAITPHVSSQYVGGKIFQGLFGYDRQLAPFPILATGWTVSSDNLVVVFTLRKDVRWHDGQPFVADDVVYTLKEAVPVAAPRFRVLYGRYLESIKALDAGRVEIRLKRPYAGLLPYLGSGLAPILPSHLYAGTDLRTNPANQHPVGTGPFVFKEWKQGAFIRLERNPNYWKAGLPLLDGIVFYVIPDAAGRAIAFEKSNVLALRAGDVDYADVKRLRALPGVQYSTQGWEQFAGMAFLELNERRAPLNNVTVRQALLHALNRQFIVDHIFFGFGKVATGPFASTTTGYIADTPQFPYDPARARELIKQSGVDVGKTVLTLVNGEKGGAWERVAEYTRQALGQVGFKIQVVTLDAASWYQRVADWDFDLSYNFLFQGSDPDFSVGDLYKTENILKGSPFGNVGGYSNAKVDALWAEAASTVDAAKRHQLYAELQRIIAGDVATANIFEMVNPTLYHDKVHDLIRTATTINDSLETTYLA
jgi:peptide/nickel transport system substrate-binding protein